VSENLFLEITVILVVSAVAGALAAKLRQPLIMAFILVGVLMGPSGLDVVSAHEQIRLFAEMGIAVLLFVVGLKLDLHLIRSTGPVAVATGLGQVVFTSIIGFLLAMLMGMGVVEAIYVAVALTFSSTIIIVKLLSDKREIDSLHGRIALGFLIVQDLAAILALIALSALGGGAVDGSPLRGAVGILLRGIAFLGTVGLLMRFVLPGLVRQLARSHELLVLFAIAWAVLLSTAGDALGFSKEVGAFLAGFSLASTSQREAISSKLGTLRDFLLIFFFIDLGAGLDFSLLGAQAGRAAVFSLFVLVGNPFVVMAIMGRMGYRKRTGFLAGLTVAQISEFSLILGAMGVALGHLDPSAMGLITLVGVVTISLSTYMILYSYPLYGLVGRFLGPFERKVPHREQREDAPLPPGVEIILLGMGRYGRNIARHLAKRGRVVLGVDFDPQAVVEGTEQGLPVHFGDAEDPDILDELPLAGARWFVCTVPGRETNLGLLRSLRGRGFAGRVVLTAHSSTQEREFREAGADRVLRPFVDAAEQAVDALTETAERVREIYPWPVNLVEVRIPAGSAVVGRSVGELALRSRTGAAVVAVNRAGRSIFDIASDFRIYPGDRLVLAGSPDALARAGEEFRQTEPAGSAPPQVRVIEYVVPEESPWDGRALAELALRKTSGLSVLAILRGEERIISPEPSERLHAGDTLTIAGRAESVAALCAGPPDAPQSCTIR
jgi:Kef-type K+ transport system membrane component KefB/Trk K+ transport system NAD-binding subunit